MTKIAKVFFIFLVIYFSTSCSRKNSSTVSQSGINSASGFLTTEFTGISSARTANQNINLHNFFYENCPKKTSICVLSDVLGGKNITVSLIGDGVQPSFGIYNGALKTNELNLLASDANVMSSIEGNTYTRNYNKIITGANNALSISQKNESYVYYPSYKDEISKYVKGGIAGQNANRDTFLATVIGANKNDNVLHGVAPNATIFSAKIDSYAMPSPSNTNITAQEVSKSFQVGGMGGVKTFQAFDISGNSLYVSKIASNVKYAYDEPLLAKNVVNYECGYSVGGINAAGDCYSSLSSGASSTQLLTSFFTPTTSNQKYTLTNGGTGATWTALEFYDPANGTAITDLTTVKVRVVDTSSHAAQEYILQSDGTVYNGPLSTVYKTLAEVDLSDLLSSSGGTHGRYILDYGTAAACTTVVTGSCTASTMSSPFFNSSNTNALKVRYNSGSGLTEISDIKTFLLGSLFLKISGGAIRSFGALQALPINATSGFVYNDYYLLDPTQNYYINSTIGILDKIISYDTTSTANKYQYNTSIFKSIVDNSTWKDKNGSVIANMPGRGTTVITSQYSNNISDKFGDKYDLSKVYIRQDNIVSSSSSQRAVEDFYSNSFFTANTMYKVLNGVNGYTQSTVPVSVPGVTSGALLTELPADKSFFYLDPEYSVLSNLKRFTNNYSGIIVIPTGEKKSLSADDFINMQVMYGLGQMAFGMKYNNTGVKIYSFADGTYKIIGSGINKQLLINSTVTDSVNQVRADDSAISFCVNTTSAAGSCTYASLLNLVDGANNNKFFHFNSTWNAYYFSGTENLSFPAVFANMVNVNLNPDGTAIANTQAVAAITEANATGNVNSFLSTNPEYKGKIITTSGWDVTGNKVSDLTNRCGNDQNRLWCLYAPVVASGEIPGSYAGNNSLTGNTDIASTQERSYAGIPAALVSGAVADIMSVADYYNVGITPTEVMDILFLNASVMKYNGGSVQVTSQKYMDYLLANPAAITTNTNCTTSTVGCYKDMVNNISSGKRWVYVGRNSPTSYEFLDINYMRDYANALTNGGVYGLYLNMNFKLGLMGSLAIPTMVNTVNDIVNIRNRDIATSDGTAVTGSATSSALDSTLKNSPLLQNTVGLSPEEFLAAVGGEKIAKKITYYDSPTLTETKFTTGTAFGDSFTGNTQLGNALSGVMTLDMFGFPFWHDLRSYITVQPNNYNIDSFVGVNQSSKYSNINSPQVFNHLFGMNFNAGIASNTQNMFNKYSVEAKNLDTKSSALSSLSFSKDFAKSFGISVGFNSLQQKSMLMEDINVPLISYKSQQNQYANFVGMNNSSLYFNYSLKKFRVDFGASLGNGVVNGAGGGSQDIYGNQNLQNQFKISSAVQNSNRLLDSALSYNGEKFSTFLSFGTLKENVNFLQSSSSGAYKFSPGSQTVYYGTGFSYKIIPQLSFFAKYSIGLTNVKAEQGSIFTDFRNVRSNSYSSGVILSSKNGVSTGFVYSQPIRVNSGKVQVAIPVGLASDGSVVSNTGYFNITPTGREQNFEVFLSKQIKNGVVSMNFMKRTEPNHVKNARSENIGFAKFSKGF